MKTYERSKFRIMARQIALEAVRNSYLEDLHADGKISQKEMRILMLDIENRLRVCLWFWDRAKRRKGLLEQIEKNLFEMGGASWDLPKSWIQST